MEEKILAEAELEVSESSSELSAAPKSEPEVINSNALVNNLVDNIDYLGTAYLKVIGSAISQRAAATQKPYRTVATWYLWRSLDALPVQYENSMSV